MATPWSLCFSEPKHLKPSEPTNKTQVPQADKRLSTPGPAAFSFFQVLFTRFCLVFTAVCRLRGAAASRHMGPVAAAPRLQSAGPAAAASLPQTRESIQTNLCLLRQQAASTAEPPRSRSSEFLNDHPHTSRPPQCTFTSG